MSRESRPRSMGQREDVSEYVDDCLNAQGLPIQTVNTTGRSHIHNRVDMNTLNPRDLGSSITSRQYFEFDPGVALAGSEWGTQPPPYSSLVDTIAGSVTITRSKRSPPPPYSPPLVHMQHYTSVSYSATSDTGPPSYNEALQNV
jgi:hypothetical protein